MIEATAELLRFRESFQKRGFDVRFVGGCVRDSLLGLKPDDFDLATDATPHEQQMVYAEDGFRHFQTGMRHGTWTVLLDPDQHVEVTTLRIDSGDRRDDVEWTRDWMTDLASRDLTINAMAQTFEGELIDPYGGAADLNDKIVRFVGNSDARIREDYLRILRFFRFQGRFGGLEYDLHALRSVTECAPGLAETSRERVWSEIAKIISVSPRIIMDIIDLDALHGILMSIGLPIKRSSIVATVIAQQHTQDPASLMACYLGDEASVRWLASDWKWSNKDRDQALFIVRNPSLGILEAKRKIAVDGVPKYWVLEALRVHKAPKKAEYMMDWDAPRFPLTAQHLLDKGMTPGPIVGETLKKLRYQWGESKFTLDRDALLGSL